MPLLRYRTRDITRLLVEPCACGRVHRRIERVLGRSDDMLIIRGVNIYPLQIERVLMGIEDLGSNYLIKLMTVNEMDELVVHVELRPGVFFDEMRRLEALREHVVTELRHQLLFTPKVEIHQPHALPVSEGKAVRVVDERAK
jgi:phenylacetate-CoA ligase